MTDAFTQFDLLRDLHALGAAPGDMLFVHSSYKSLGPVAGGAEAVVKALEEAVGPEGLVLMPSFNLVQMDQRAATWNPATTPSTVGYLTEYFRQLPGTFRSDHYSHSVAARGTGAEAFAAGHLAREGYDSPWDRPPWGKTYGTHSPMLRAYRDGGKVLMLGVDYHSSTYMHVVEVMSWNRARKDNPDAKYRWLDRDKVGAFWDAHGQLNRGKIGHAGCRLFGIREYVDGLLAEVTEHPEYWRND